MSVEAEKWHGSVSEMMETIIDHEFYCHDYAAKEQPHAQGLLHTLHDSMMRSQRFEKRPLPAESPLPPTAAFDATRSLFQRLVAATNRRIHKGMPSVYAYLMGLPNHYASHAFVKYSFGQLLHNFFCEVVRRFPDPGENNQMPPNRECDEGVATDPTPDVIPVATSVRPTELGWDYPWRPTVMKDFPLYFFQAATDVATNLPAGTGGTYLWYEAATSPEKVEVGKHPCFKASLTNPKLWAKSHTVKDKHGHFEQLFDEETRHKMYNYDHYRVLPSTSPGLFLYCSVKCLRRRRLAALPRRRVNMLSL